MNHKPLNLLLVILFIITCSIKAQDSDYIIVKGVIVNLALNPIPFANIVSQKTSKGTFGDDKGNFSFRTERNDTLIFSAISFKTKKMAVAQLLYDQNLIILDSMVYMIRKVDVMEIRWKEFEYQMLNMKLSPMEQNILVIKGLPNPYTELVQIKPNLVLNPISAIYELLKPENIRKRKQERWNNTYDKTWIKYNGSQIKKP